MEQREELDRVDLGGPRAAEIDAAATVATPAGGVEEPVVGKERWEQVQRLRAAGMPVARIARATDLDRKTVRRCLRQAECGGRISAHR